MLIIKKLSFFFVLLFFQLQTFAQELEEVEEDYASEFIYGINLNTLGGLIGGLMFKTTRIVKPKVYRSLGFEIVGIKHPKEIRFQSGLTGNTFLLGKRNYFYSLRLQYGRDFILFRKAAEEGVMVSAIFAGGPSLGLQVPYYITYEDRDRGRVVEQYDPLIHNNDQNILGTGGFLQGLGETNLLYGLHLKTGISLDFGAFRNSITGLEAGFTFEAFDRIPEILAAPLQADNRQIFSAAYLTIFFGSRK